MKRRWVVEQYIPKVAKKKTNVVQSDVKDGQSDHNKVNSMTGDVSENDVTSVEREISIEKMSIKTSVFESKVN